MPSNAPRRLFFDLNEKDTFNQLEWLPFFEEKTKTISWPPWLTAPVHYQKMPVITGIDWACEIKAEYIMLPGIPGYRIVQKGDCFYYERVK